jgi:hypothetical protein
MFKLTKPTKIDDNTYKFPLFYNESNSYYKIEGQ